MSQRRKPRVTGRQPAPVASVQAVDRAPLERCGLVNADGQVVGAPSGF
jgi:hypothetical protein